MTEEEYFRKNFPDSCYGDKPLSPHWDYFQYGVEFGEQESEKQIKELEQKLEQTEKDLADYQFNYPTIQELEKEIKEWKDKADLWCKTANLKDHNIMINKELEKENAELKERVDNLYNSDCWASDQLTKAKEIIKGLLNSCFGYNSKTVNYEVKANAEQFLKNNA